MVTKKELLRLLEGMDDEHFIFLLSEEGVPLHLNPIDPVIEGNIKLGAELQYGNEIENFIVPVIILNAANEEFFEEETEEYYE